jgi:hypothetical protein
MTRKQEAKRKAIAYPGKVELGLRRSPTQHGLAIPLVLNPEMAEQCEQFARSIAKRTSSPSLLEQARELVACMLEVLRVGAARSALLERKITEQESSVYRDRRPLHASLEVSGAIAALPGLEAMERYERRAFSHLRRTVQRFRYCEWLNSQR